MAYKLDIGAKIDGTLIADSGRVVVDGNGVEHAIMSAVVYSSFSDRRIGRIGVVDHAHIGFPISSAFSVPFVGTHFCGTVTGALNRKTAPHKLKSGTALTIGEMQTNAIDTDRNECRLVERRPQSVISWLLGGSDATPQAATKGRFGAPSAADVLARWRDEGYSTLDRNPAGIKMRLSAKSELHFQGKDTSFSGSLDDAHVAARASLEFIRDRSEGVLTIGADNPRYVMSLWAHAQLMHVVVSNYEPPPERQQEAMRLVEDLRADYARANVILRPFSPEAAVRTGDQRLYASRRPRWLRRVI